ncbi:MAG: prephenate dehydratase domain-containing protein [Kiritimatiellae bacterium]|nr:prephenate dehydratase domain-containing protein [Kiritimatiellia bacterium]
MKNQILYLGPEGTHSHEAALTRFGENTQLIPCLSHEEIFERLCSTIRRGRPLAIVPVENSSEGPVTQTLDQLAACSRVTITESFSINIRHHLLVPPGIRSKSMIRRVYSHPQALGQCRASLQAYLPGVERQPESSTAAAARRVSRESDAAALASTAAATFNGLRILKSDMQDSDANVTRFFVVTAGRAKPLPSPSTEYRSLIHLVIGNRPGALLHALAPFDASGVNLTFIQSRPLPGRPWEYGFFIEAATDWKTARAEAAWRLVLALSESGRKIGTYPIG